MHTAGRMFFAAAMLCLLSIPTARAEDGKDESIRRETPSGQYVDPSSFFRFHGYNTLNLSFVNKRLGTEPNATPQILLSGPSPRTGKNQGGFKNDLALFVGGEPFEGVGTVIELHFVGNALDPVVTEAKVYWDLAGKDGNPFTLRLVGGRFWWPFGIHNDEWFSSVNRLSLVSPAAAEVVPAHYNEVGIMAEGEIKLAHGAGANYALSLGNGVPSFELMDNVTNTAFAQNGAPTVTGRVGLVLHHKSRLEIGFSASRGDLRSAEDPKISPGDPRRYVADFWAFGPDLTFKWNGVGLRSYYYRSRENLVNASRKALDREGLTAEPSYTFGVNARRLKSVTLLGRFSYADREMFDGREFRRLQYGAGVNFHVTKAFQTKFGYVLQKEKKDTPRVDNNAFSISMTAEF